MTDHKTIVYKILTDPQYTLLATSFYQTFLGIELVEAQVDAFADTLFITKGAFSDDLEIIGKDALGVKHVIHIRFIEMHPGLTSGHFEMHYYKWRDFTQYAQNKGYRYFGCQTVREVCFFSFDIFPHANSPTVFTYDFAELPKMVQFDCYELEKFTSDKVLSDRDIWLQIFKNGIQPVLQPSESPLIEGLNKVFNTKNWTKAEQAYYKDRQKWRGERSETMLARYKDSNFQLDDHYLGNPAKVATWGWHILERQWGKLPKNVVKPSAINKQPLEADIPKLAFDLFRKWSNACRAKHPHLDLTIINEQILIKDVMQQVANSVIAVFNADTFYWRNMSKNYAVAYFIGQLEGALSQHWYLEYIIKTMDTFKTAMALQSLNLYLQSEEVTRLKVEQIYQEVMKGKVNLANPHLEIQKIDLTSKSGKVLQENEATNNIEIVLTNLTNEYINKISQIEIENFDIEVSAFMDENKVLQLIEVNWGLFL